MQTHSAYHDAELDRSSSVRAVYDRIAGGPRMTVRTVQPLADDSEAPPDLTDPCQRPLDPRWTHPIRSTIPAPTPMPFCRRRGRMPPRRFTPLARASACASTPPRRRGGSEVGTLAREANPVAQSSTLAHQRATSGPSVLGTFAHDDQN